MNIDINSLLSFIGTLIGSIAGILIANKLTNFRLEQLEKKIDKNDEKQEKNSERLIIVEQSTKSAHHRLDDITQQLNIHERRNYDGKD